MPPSRSSVSAMSASNNSKGFASLLGKSTEQLENGNKNDC